MNTRPIASMTGITSNGKITIDSIALTNFSGYDFNGESGKIEYALGSVTNGNFTSLLNGSMGIPTEIVQQWGENDDIIWDYVISKIQEQNI